MHANIQQRLIRRYKTLLLFFSLISILDDTVVVQSYHSFETIRFEHAIFQQKLKSQKLNLFTVFEVAFNTGDNILLVAQSNVIFKTAKLFRE